MWGPPGWQVAMQAYGVPRFSLGLTAVAQTVALRESSSKPIGKPVRSRGGLGPQGRDPDSGRTQPFRSLLVFNFSFVVWMRSQSAHQGRVGQCTRHRALSFKTLARATAVSLAFKGGAGVCTPNPLARVKLRTCARSRVCGGQGPHAVPLGRSEGCGWNAARTH